MSTTFGLDMASYDWRTGAANHPSERFDCDASGVLIEDDH
jgi:hypothetical protein